MAPAPGSVDFAAAEESQNIRIGDRSKPHTAALFGSLKSIRGQIVAQCHILRITKLRGSQVLAVQTCGASDPESGRTTITAPPLQQPATTCSACPFDLINPLTWIRSHINQVDGIGEQRLPLTDRH